MSETQPLLANEIDRYGRAGNGPENYRNYPSTVQLQDVNAKGTRPGSAYAADGGSTETECICKTTDTASMAACMPCCWMCLPFGCTTVEVGQENVLMVYGEYFMTLKTPGMHYINPIGLTRIPISIKATNMDIGGANYPIKVADGDGNPVIVSGVVSFRIINVKAAALDVQNAGSYVQRQAESILKQVVSRYPYASHDGSPSLKTESTEISLELMRALQERATVAGVLIESFELADLSYAPEIAQVMLVRQQAKATVDARQTIVDGAVGIVQKAVEKLTEAGIPLGDAEKSKLVTNLLTVICGEKGTQPVLDIGV